LGKNCSIKEKVKIKNNKKIKCFYLENVDIRFDGSVSGVKE